MELTGVNVELVEQLHPLLASQDLQLGLLLAQSMTQPEQSVATLQGLPSSLGCPGESGNMELPYQSSR